MLDIASREGSLTQLESRFPSAGCQSFMITLWARYAGNAAFVVLTPCKIAGQIENISCRMYRIQRRRRLIACRDERDCEEKTRCRDWIKESWRSETTHAHQIAAKNSVSQHFRGGQFKILPRGRQSPGADHGPNAAGADLD